MLHPMLAAAAGIAPLGASFWMYRRWVTFWNARFTAKVTGIEDDLKGLRFPLRDFTPPGTALTVEIDGERKAATVHALPFVKGS